MDQLDTRFTIRHAWTAFGFLVYLSIAFILPVVTRLLGVYSDEPLTWFRLIVPMVMIPFLMGYAQVLFGGIWRLMLWSPAVVMLAISVFAIVDDLTRADYLKQDLVFWPTMIASYLAFSYLGKLTRDRLTVVETKRVD